ncbi:hypothetical protein SLEP1_g8028 [Rubroshorea leprosula]|uniref:Acidic leucine-rich nuclear phosphoprotein 32-related protein n=1 Tax=Rubroshorea leprosula TaxID=152421 RepID=A0AAV5I8A1_9ROSI|nr:hypothetical protein SLEP1_g8028 [Rubroshorea leprosula]
MDEIWERAVETALNGERDYAATRTLTLDGAVKAVTGRLPPTSLLEKFGNLQHLSIANNGVPSLEHFPRLRNLQKLILSDNRIAGGLEYLVEAGLESLRDLDLSNNRIQCIEDLAPLAQLKLVSLDLYECPVTRVKDYRSRVFGLIKSLKYLDKMDADENERPDSDEEEEEEEDEEEDEEDPGNEETEGEDRRYKLNNGHSEEAEGIIEVNDDEESDADEEIDTSRQRNGYRHQANGFRVEEAGRDGGEDEESDSGEEVDDDDDDDVVEVYEVEDSDDDDVEVEEDDDEEEVDNDEGEFVEQGINGQLTSTEGEIDGHEQGEEDEDDIGETGEEEQGVDDGEFEGEEEGEEEDDDSGEGYLIQPGRQDEEHDAGGSDMDSGNEEQDTEEEEVDNEDDVQALPPRSHQKRKRSDDDGDEDEDEDEDEDDEDVVDYSKSS